jgi:outer membrane protein OmpA-like peptidoglycan-associated protein
MPEAGPTPQVTVRVLDASGNVVRDAELALAGESIGRTDAMGELIVSRELGWRRGPVIAADGFEDAAVPEPGDDEDLVEVRLGWTPVEVLLRVVDPTGSPLDADLTLTGEGDAPVPVRDDLGTFRFPLTAGLWTLEIAAPGRGAQIRNLVVPEGRRRPMQLDAVLYETSGDGEMVLTVIDPDGDPIEGAYVQVGGRVVGTTGTGGDLRVTALEEGTSSVAVSHEDFERTEPIAVELVPGGSPTAVALTHLPGSVEVWVRGPDGQPTDALLALKGPSSLPPIRVGRDGRHVVVLSEGEWSLVVSSPTLGMQVRSFEVDRDDPELRRIQVDLLPAGGLAELSIRVADREGQPIPEAEVVVDGRSTGHTGTDGRIRLADLAARPVAVEVRAPRTRGWIADVDLTEGLADLDVTLDWLPGSVTVRAMGPDGVVQDARVTATSPGQKTVSDWLDRRGHVDLELPPGPWEVLVSASALGVQARTLTVEADQTTLVTVDFRLAQSERGRGELQLSVVAPDGTPIDGARVVLDGEGLGSTSNAGAVRLLDLRTGLRTVRIEADGHEPVQEEIRLVSGTSEQRVELPRAPGAVRLSLRRGDAPLTDALVRFAGPNTLPPLAPDPRGNLQAALVPGEWTVLISSPSAGMRQEQLTIAPDDGLRIVELDLGAPPTETAVLLLRVRDEDHVPLEGAGVAQGERALGTTSAGGMVLLSDLQPGPVTLTVTPAAPLQPRTMELDLPPGSHQATVLVAWPRSTVTLHTEAAQGPLAARVYLDGPAVVPLLTTDARGVTTVELRAGPWRAYGDAGDEVGATDFELVDAPLQVDIALERLLVAEETGSFRFEDAVLFGTGRAALRQDADGLLDAIAEHLRHDASIVLAEVQGHTDDVGSMEVNLALSQRRAETVVAALIERGVAPERLRARGYAMLRPVAPGTDAEARSANRRVEVHVVERTASADW